jgi:hypothetical protein
LAVEGFSEAMAVAGSITACDAPVNSASNDDCFSPGEIIPGVRFVDNPGPETDGLALLGANFAGTSNPGNILTNKTFANLYDVEFA